MLTPPAMAEETELLVPDNLCQEVTIELLRAVEEGYMTEEHAKDITQRCYTTFGSLY